MDVVSALFLTTQDMLDDGYDLLRLNRLDLEAAQRGATVSAIASLSVLVLLIGLASVTMKRRVLRPVAALQRLTEQVIDGHLDVRLNLLAPNEIGQLGRSFDSMTQQLQQSREDMQRTGMQSVGDILQNSTVMGSPAISRASALSSGEAVGGTFVSLRNLGAQRTLVLLNGQRLGVSTGGLADVSQIPTAMVERIEILKDGASAIYGSDAIAGVVNIITRKRVEGGEANDYLGQYDTDGGAKQSYDATFGAVGDRSWVTADRS